jgi:hypothetical protein
MNWKLIFLLSLFGLGMAFATISAIPMKIEPICWLVIFIICAYAIAKNAPGNYFLHGFLVSLVNCIWVTGAHVYFYTTYIANHPDMVDMSAKLPMQDHPRWQMLVTGPVFGIVSGLVLGLFAFIAARLMKKSSAPAVAK